MSRVIVILLLGILFRCALAEKNFFNNEICSSDSDCTGLTSCHIHFGCTLSGAKVGLVMLVVFVGLVLLILALVWLCRGNLGRNNFRRPHNHYLPQTVITTNTQPAWNQQQMGGISTTTVYPHNPYPNQFYANSVNPPAYNPYLTDPRIGAGINQMPTSPYPPPTVEYK